MPQVDWNARYEVGDTPWDKGAPHPALPILLESDREIFEGKAVFVPGCGYGYEAAHIARVAERVTAVDIAKEPIEVGPRLQAEENIVWKLGDFFTWEDSYEVVFEHACFCAIPVERRADYAVAVSRLLEPGGFLCGVYFLTPDHDPDEGPPFGSTKEELHGLLDPYFDLVWDRVPPATFEGRDGRETMMLWQRKAEG